LIGHRRFDRVSISAAIGEHAHLIRLISTARIFQVARAEVIDDELRLGSIITMRRQALPFARVRARRKRHEAVMADQPQSRPRMTAAEPLAMMASCGVDRRHTGTRWDRALPQACHRPGQTVSAWSRGRTWRGSTLGKLWARLDGHVGGGLSPLTAGGCVTSRPARGCFAGGFPGDDPQHASIADADPFETWSDGDTTCDPRRSGARRPGASPLSPRPWGWRGLRSRPPGAGSPSPCQSRHGWEREAASR
jgi:hypothetical protein